MKREPQTLEGFRVEHDRRIDLMLLQASCSVDSSEPANSEDIDCPQLEHFSEPDDTDSEISIGACSESSIGERCHEAESQTESFSSSRSCQTPSDSNSFELQLKDFLKSLNIDIRKDFTSQDIKRYFSENPGAKIFFENGIGRRHKQAKHTKDAKDIVVAHALKQSLSSAMDFSDCVGGPKRSTVKNACVPKVRILPYLDVSNLEDHLAHFKETMERVLGVEMNEVPVQASLDATAVTGRVYSRAALKEGDDRLLYGIATPGGAFQKTGLSLSSDPNAGNCTINGHGITLHNLDCAPDLFEEGVISKATSYVAIVLVPLHPKARPYCCGIFSVTKGTDSNTILKVHRQLMISSRNVGIKLVTLPGDGDTILRSIQWGYYDCKRSSAWLSTQRVPVELFFSDNGENPLFPFQDVLHNLKKGRNNVKLLSTRVLTLGHDVTRQVFVNGNWDIFA